MNFYDQWTGQGSKFRFTAFIAVGVLIAIFTILQFVGSVCTSNPPNLRACKIAVFMSPIGGNKIRSSGFSVSLGIAQFNEGNERAARRSFAKAYENSLVGRSYAPSDLALRPIKDPYHRALARHFSTIKDQQNPNLTDVWLNVGSKFQQQ